MDLLKCPTCRCTIHQAPRTWEVRCAVCGEKRWPYSVVNPEPYTCSRCLATSPEKREAARAAGRKSAERRLRKAHAS